MKANKKNAFELNLGFLPIKVYVVLTREAYESLRLNPVAFNPAEWNRADASCLYSPKDNKIALVFDAAKMKTLAVQQVVGLVAHEASHACDHVAEDLGKAGDAWTGEPRAYLQQALTQWTCARMIQCGCFGK